MTKNDPAKTAWKALAFQYKPLEVRFLRDLKTANMPEIAKKYMDGSYIVKIQMLDKFANFLGL